MKKTLAGLHRTVRRALSRPAALRKRPARRNPKGDLPEPFDLAADAAARRYLTRAFGAAAFLTEESGEVVEGRGTPAWRFVIDPVDGSVNRARRLRPSALSVAALPAAARVSVAAVRWAMVGDLGEGSPWIACRGKGVFRGSRRCRTSGQRSLSTALLSCEISGALPPAMGRVIARAGKGARALGCASVGMALVADGTVDAFVDLRRGLSVEDLLAAAMLVEEAGGAVRFADGGGTDAPLSGIGKRYGIVCAATHELLKEIFRVIRGRRGC